MNHRHQRQPVIVLAAALSFLSVAAGAFGAHGAKSILSAPAMAVYETAVDYQFFHSLALLVVGVLIALPIAINKKALTLAVGCFTVGIVLFSGSLYLYAFTGITKLGMITPLGGLLFLVGWLMLGVAAWSSGNPKR